MRWSNDHDECRSNNFFGVLEYFAPNLGPFWRDTIEENRHPDLLPHLKNDRFQPTHWDNPSGIRPTDQSQDVGKFDMACVIVALYWVV